MKRLNLTAIVTSVALSITGFAQAQIVAVGTGSSGILAPPVSGDDSFTTGSFNNTGDFLVLSLSAADNNGDFTSSIAPPSVTFGTQTMILAASNQRSTRSFSAIYYLADPAVGSAAFSIDFGADVMTSTGRLVAGYASLNGVAENPIAATGNIINTTTATISAVSDPVVAGDFLFTALTPDDGVDVPQYETATAQTATVVYDEDFAGANNRTAQSFFIQSLVDGDINGSGDVELTRIGSRSESGVGVIFRAIPEPTGAAFLLGGLGLLALRRRRR
ncbi:MAG: PEP-CTERM sorting domain-containing protein [Verrucomicrobiota bacterium]